MKPRRHRTVAAQAGILLFLAFPSAKCARAWGDSGQKLVVEKAVETLPAQVRPYFEANRDFLIQHVGDAGAAAAKSPAERKNHFLYLDRYGRFPYKNLPRSYQEASDKFMKFKLNANGLLPWQIGVYSAKLTNAMKTGNWEEARMDAAWLASYVEESRDPFHTTDNFDGQLSGQPEVQARFGTALIDRYSSFFPMQPSDAAYVADPTDHAFEACLSSHSWIENILLADRNARLGLPAYTDEYYDRFYNQTAAILIRQLSDAASDVGSYWYTAWVNAGKPALPPR